MQHNLDGFERETQLHKSVNDARLQGAQVLLSRSARKSQQARRAEDAVGETVTAAVAEVEKRAELERTVAAAKSKQEVEEIQANADAARLLTEKQAADITARDDRIARLKRLVVVGAVMAVAIFVVVVLWSNEVLDGQTLYAVLAGLVLAAVAGGRIVTHGVREGGWWLVAAIIIPVLLQVIFAVAG